MPYYPKEFVLQVIEANPLAEVVAEYVNLSKRSGRNRFGLCPFHSEKTPSFSISEEKQYFHCFGCKKSGNVIDFIREVEHLDYTESIVFLAKRANLTLPEIHKSSASIKKEEIRKKLKKINALAANFFYLSLRQKVGYKATSYLQARGYKADLANTFALGYAPASWDSLLRFLKEKMPGKENLDLATHLGLLKERDGRYYDAFRDRLIFPILNSWGEVIAFGARRLEDEYASFSTKKDTKDEYVPKYINSPESNLYKKGDHLYAFHLAKKSTQASIILVEGYMDAISLNSAGFDQAVAVLGTGFTSKQLDILKRLNKKVILAFDQDEAGREATFRALSLLTPTKLEVAILHLPEEKDPDAYLKKKGKEALNTLFQSLKNPFEFVISYFEAKYQNERGLDTHLCIENILSWLKVADYTAVKREELLQILAVRYKLPASILKEDFIKAKPLLSWQDNQATLASSSLMEASYKKVKENLINKEDTYALDRDKASLEFKLDEKNDKKIEGEGYLALPISLQDTTDRECAMQIWQSLQEIKEHSFLYREEWMIFHLYLRSSASFQNLNYFPFSDYFLSPLSRHFARYILKLPTYSDIHSGKLAEKFEEVKVFENSKNNFSFEQVMSWAKFYNFYQGPLDEFLLKLQFDMEGFYLDKKTCEYWTLKLLVQYENQKLTQLTKKATLEENSSLVDSLNEALAKKQTYLKALEKFSFMN